MTTATAPCPVETPLDNTLDHIWCCDPNLALCGTDLTDVPEIDIDEVDCVVCAELEFLPCPICAA